MKLITNPILLTLSLYFYASTAFSNNFNSTSGQKRLNFHPDSVIKDIPHLDLELTSSEYQRLESQIYANLKSSADPLKTILDVGTRNLEWIKYINSTRAEDSALRLSNPQLQTGVPIEKPNVASRTLITQSFDLLKNELPSVFTSVLLNRDAFTADLEMSDEMFLQYSRRVDRSYQQASRWLLQEPNLSSYARRSTQDIRGVYFLSRLKNLKETLDRYSTLNESEKNQIQTWLVGMCRNSNLTASACLTRLDQSVQQNESAYSFYTNYLAQSQRVYDSYFSLYSVRKDVTWNSSNPLLMSVPFLNPSVPLVGNWLKYNVEDEFKLEDWRFELALKDTPTMGIATIKFVPGSTPHVTGGNVIVMDENQDLEEYNTRWTIRHEYGHILGLPDCYVEFYDSAKEQMISYQIDISDLMCSRRGSFKLRHYETLKSAYYK